VDAEEGDGRRGKFGLVQGISMYAEGAIALSRPGAKTALCFSLGIRLFRAPAANTFCPTDSFAVGSPFAGRGGAVVALSTVDLSFPGEVWGRISGCSRRQHHPVPHLWAWPDLA